MTCLGYGVKPHIAKRGKGLWRAVGATSRVGVLRAKDAASRLAKQNNVGKPVTLFHSQWISLPALCTNPHFFVVK